MIQQKKNERAMSITFHFLRGLKKVLLHTYVVAGRRLLKNTVCQFKFLVKFYTKILKKRERFNDNVLSLVPYHKSEGIFYLVTLYSLLLTPSYGYFLCILAHLKS